MLPWFDLYRHARSTKFPQVATVTSAYALIWWIETIAVVFVASLLASRVGRKHLRLNHSFKQLAFVVLLAPLLGALCFFGALGLPGDPGIAKGLTTDSRIGYLFMTTLGIEFSALCFGMWPIALLGTFDSLFKADHRA